MVRCLFGVGFVVASLFAPRSLLGAHTAPQTQPDTVYVTLAEARRSALQANPQLAVSIQRLRAAEGGVRQARTFPFNPSLEFESPGLAASGASREFEARVAQEIPLAGQWGLSVDIAEFEASASGWEARDAARLLLRDVEKAFNAATAADRRLQLAVEISALSDSLGSAIATELAEGEVSSLNASLVTIETARGRARVLSAQREATTARLELARLMGGGFGSEVRPIADTSFSQRAGTEAPEALLVTAFRDRPDLLAADERVGSAEAARTLAGRRAIPNPIVVALVDRPDPSLPSRFGFGVEIPLPFFDRGQGERASSSAALRGAEFDREGARQRVENDVRESLESVRLARAELTILAAEVLGPARDNIALLDIAYREGKLDLSALLLLRNQLLDAQSSYWDAWQRWRDAEVDLRTATGGILDDYNVPTEASR